MAQIDHFETKQPPQPQWPLATLIIRTAQTTYFRSANVQWCALAFRHHVGAQMDGQHYRAEKRKDDRQRHSLPHSVDGGQH
ncbi:MAG: hypothetical protein ACUVSB_13015, partial [Anaerolineae bacterium]